MNQLFAKMRSGEPQDFGIRLSCGEEDSFSCGEVNSLSANGSNSVLADVQGHLWFDKKGIYGLIKRHLWFDKKVFMV